MPFVNGRYVPSIHPTRPVVGSHDPTPGGGGPPSWHVPHVLGGGTGRGKRPPGVVPGISEYFPPGGEPPGGPLSGISEYFPPGSKGPIPGRTWGPPHEMPPVGGPRYPRAPGGAHTPGMPPPVYDGNGSWPRRPPAGHGMPPTGGPRYATKAQRILNVQVPAQQGPVPFGGEPYPRKIHVARGAAARKRKGMARKMLRYHGRMAMKAELQRLAGFLPAAVKSVDPWAIDQWTASMQQGVGSREEAVEALGDLLQAGVPEESYAEVSAAIGEMLAGLEEDEAADAAGAYDQEDALYEGGYDDGGPEAYYGDDDDGTVEYSYAGDDGMGEFKALSPAEEFEDAAQALASRSLEILSAQPAIKSVGFQAPYFHTHAPHGDRLAHLKAFDQFIRLGETRMDRMLFEHLQGATKAAMQEDTDSEGGLALAA